MPRESSRVVDLRVLLACCAVVGFTPRVAAAQTVQPNNSIGSQADTLGRGAESAAAAKATPHASGLGPGWYAGVASGWFFPVQRWPSPYVLGGGGSYFFGRQVTDRWGAQLETNMWLLSGDARSTWDSKTAALVTFTPVRARVAPFVETGVGFDFQQNYPTKQSTAGPAIPLGAGLRFMVGSRSALLIEATHYVLFRPVATRDVPLLAGFRLGF